MNDPVNWNDPSGLELSAGELCIVTWSGFAGATVGAAVGAMFAGVGAPAGGAAGGSVTSFAVTLILGGDKWDAQPTMQ